RRSPLACRLRPARPDGLGLLDPHRPRRRTAPSGADPARRPLPLPRDLRDRRSGRSLPARRRSLPDRLLGEPRPRLAAPLARAAHRRAPRSPAGDPGRFPIRVLQRHAGDGGSSPGGPPADRRSRSPAPARRSFRRPALRRPSPVLRPRSRLRLRAGQGETGPSQAVERRPGAPLAARGLAEPDARASGPSRAQFFPLSEAQRGPLHTGPPRRPSGADPHPLALARPLSRYRSRRRSGRGGGLLSKVMFVTVGTSLFHSASWETDSLTAEIREYREWTAGNALCSPEARKRTRNAERIEAALEKGLCAGDYDLWTRRLPEDLLSGSPNMDTVMRYSAELATILKTWNLTSEFQTFGDFLRSYSTIHLLADPSFRLPFQAARHLAPALNTLARNVGPAQLLPVYGFSSTDPGVLLGDHTGLGRLARFILQDLKDALQVDLVVSGGYKLYGITFTSLLWWFPEKKVRLLYIHEEGNLLMQVPKVLRDRTSGEEQRREAPNVGDFINVGA